MLIRSDLLHYLSLFMYNVKTRHTDLFLDPICNFSTDDSIPPKITPGPENYCKPNNSTGHHLLNNLTANLLSYAMHRKSVVDNGIDLADESGYSVYVFDTDNPSDYCVFNEVPNFARMRVLFFTAFGLLEVTSIFSIPVLLASVYEEFQRKMKAGNLRYFVWASLIMIFLLIPLFLVCNVYAIVNVLNSPGTHFHDVYGASIAMSAVLFLMFAADVVTAIFVVKRLKVIATSREKINCLGWHRRLCSEYQNINENDQVQDDWWTNLKYCIHYIVIVVLTYFTQLLLFNFVFVLIGAVAAPVETGSLLLLYITSLFSLVSFFALILKVFHNRIMKDKQRLDEENDRQRRRIPEHQDVTISKTQYFFRFLGFIILVCTLAAGIGVTVSFIYIYTVLNQEYRNNRGIITFLGALLPSFLASMSGVFWTRVLPCIGGNNNDQENERRELLDEHLQLLRLEREYRERKVSERRLRQRQWIQRQQTQRQLNQPIQRPRVGGEEEGGLLAESV